MASCCYRPASLYSPAAGGAASFWFLLANAVRPTDGTKAAVRIQRLVKNTVPCMLAATRRSGVERRGCGESARSCHRTTRRGGAAGLWTTERFHGKNTHRAGRCGAVNLPKDNEHTASMKAGLGIASLGEEMEQCRVGRERRGLWADRTIPS
ncbi:MAG: hypothetical protein HYR55_01120 [Acidobacteria bacterium]|nr:hypothetical protein [Acidobacteriota bacterium]